MASDSLKRDLAEGAALWQGFLSGRPPLVLSNVTLSALQRFSVFAGTRYALHLLGSPDGILPSDRLGAERTWARLQFERTQELLLNISQAGFDFLLLKGQALARTLYPDPSLRLGEDVDLLVRPGQLPALLSWLKAKGFVLQALPQKPWGFMSDSSFWPLLSPDRRIALDLHLQADSYPFHRGLDAEAVFARAVTLPGSGLRLPCREHLMLLLISNAAKMKFGPHAWRRATDLSLFLRQEEPVNWEEMVHYLYCCGLARAGASLFSLLAALGQPAQTLPPASVLAGLPQVHGLALSHVLVIWRSLDDRLPSLPVRFWRELLLSAGLKVTLKRNLRRLAGLFRRPTGTPPGWQGPVLPAP